MLGVLNSKVIVKSKGYISLGGINGDIKKWYGYTMKDDKQVNLFIKTASSRQGFTGFEPEAECVACRLANMLGLPCVKYDLMSFHVASKTYKVCVCEDFTKGSESANYVDILPFIGKLSGLDKYNTVISVVPNSRPIIDSILVFDYIIANKDRHLRNIEILSDKNGNLKLAPIFDNGMSLFSDESEATILQNLSTSSNFVHSRPFLNPHYRQLSLVDFNNIHFKAVKKEEVYRLVNTYFKGNRAKYINKWLILRLKELNLLL